LNKYEENISDIITLDATEEIVDIFLEYFKTTDKIIGIIANKELIEYAMGEALSHDWINVRKVDIELDNLEYMISIDNDGDLVVQPVTDFDDKYFSSMEIVYISMDGDVSQDVIDYCVDRDKNVILFGYEDECCDCCGCCDCDCYEEDMGGMITPTASYMVNGEMVTREVFEQYEKAFSERLAKIEREISDFKRNIFFW